MEEEIIRSIKKQLVAASDEKTKAVAQRFFKNKVKFHGVRAARVAEIARENFRIVKDWGKKRVFAACEQLLRSGISEEAWIAAGWAYRLEKQFTPDDMDMFEDWIGKYVDDWAKCDTLCNHAVGTLVEKFPEHLATLKIWAKSSNMWLRRAAAVSLIIPAKKGLFLKDIFTIADILLQDKEDLVQKGYGWMLKAASAKHENEVFEYVIRHKAVMPRTALRYAIEKMRESLKKMAMAK